MTVPPYLRSCVLWGMLPLACLAGVRVPECECSSGEHRFFCERMLATVVRPRAADQDVRLTKARACCCRQIAQSDRQADRTASGARSAARSPCGHCKAVLVSTSAVNKSLTLPALERTPGLVSFVGAELSISSGSASSADLASVRETGPPADRLIVFCRLLI